MRRLGFLYLLILTWGVAPLYGSPLDQSEWPLVQDSIKEKKKSIFEFLVQLPYDELTIVFDFDSLKERLYEDEYLPASLSYHSEVGQAEWDIEVRPRGKFRRKICDFPPLKVKFKKKGLKKMGLRQKYNKLKIVTHCKDEYEDKDLVLREFLIYKMYNVITDKSYRVRHFRINWINQNSGSKIGEQWAFFIESDEELAKRLDGKLFKFTDDEPFSIIEESRTVLPLFQYMIGNHDHSIEMAKNIELIKQKSNGKLIVVPYDFDYSGVVNAPYAYADPIYQLDHKRDRRFLGSSTDEELLKPINYLNEQKDSILSIVKDFKDLRRKHRRDVISYIEDYFEIVASGMPVRVPED